MGTPISEAYSRYRKLRRKGVRRLSREERIWYYTYRSFRSYSKDWNRSGKVNLTNRLEDSLAEQRERLAEWKEFETWAESRTASNAKNQGHWEKFFLSKIREDVDNLERHVEDYSDDDNVLDTVVDMVAAAANDLQLTLDGEMTDEDDGCVWFVDDETGKNYFWAMNYYRGLKVTDTVAASERAKTDERWREYNGISLNQFALEIQRPTNASYDRHHPARVLNDHFGLYNGLGIKEGEDLPDSVEKALSKLSRINRRS